MLKLLNLIPVTLMDTVLYLSFLYLSYYIQHNIRTSEGDNKHRTTPVKEVNIRTVYKYT